MDFLANENFPLTSIRYLRNAGYNVTSISEETPGAKDLDILKRANAECRVILTFDRDYGELIYHYGAFIRSGVAYFRFDPITPIEAGEILLNILLQSNLVLAGKFTVIERSGIRQRNLTRPGMDKGEDKI